MWFINRILRRIVCFRPQNTTNYSFFISFWFSGRLKKTYIRFDAITQKCKNFGSLITINGFSRVFWNVSGRYKSSWIRPYNECYEQKDTLYRQTMWFTNKILRRIACFRQHTQKNGLLAIMYSFFSSFWFSGRYKKKTYVSDAKVLIFRLARSARSQPLMGSFSSFWSV